MEKKGRPFVLDENPAVAAIKDGIRGVLEKLSAADGLLVGSPVYFECFRSAESFWDRYAVKKGK